ncbi:MAG: alpha/beta hydrolase, partial [Serratia symbiotica]|nr:alpha/beta hydrolase [Serratia symbiotica]
MLLAAAVHLPTYAKPLLHAAVPQSSMRWQYCQNSEFQHWFMGPPPLGLRCGYVEVPLIHQVNASNMLPGNNGTVRLALTLLPATGVKKG